MVADLKPIPQDVQDSVFDADFWRNFSPKFHISDQTDKHVVEMGDNYNTAHRRKLVREGYTHMEQVGIKSPYTDIADMFSDMVSKGVPAVFSFVYDEMWHINSQIRKLIAPMFEGKDFAMLPDFWAWHVAPGQSGWSPHRDKGPACLFPDKTPKSLTVWMPMTEAHPLNGCMYLIPAHLDPNYGKGGPQGGNLPMTNIYPPHIRALPGMPGDVFIWTQHVFHWGSASADEHDMGPRMSIAFEYQLLEVPAWNRPLMPPDILPTFEQRLALIAKQVKQYTHMYKFGPDLIEIADRILAKHHLPAGIERS